jgi:hypothetical protein
MPLLYDVRTVYKKLKVHRVHNFSLHKKIVLIKLELTDHHNYHLSYHHYHPSTIKYNDICRL